MKLYNFKLGIRLFSILGCLTAASWCCVAQAEGGFQKGRSFVEQCVPNDPNNNICMGIAASLECLERSREIEGVESSAQLSERLWVRLTNADKKRARFFCYKSTGLQNGTVRATCDRESLKEVASLIQLKYVELVETQVWQKHLANLDSDSPLGKRVLDMRAQYANLVRDGMELKVTSRHELEQLFSGVNEDRVVGIVCGGYRSFKNNPPQSVIDKHSLKFDAESGGYAKTVPSHHAVLLSYSREDDVFYCRDSDDPVQQWPVKTGGEGASFHIRWLIESYMGNGPAMQVYSDVRPLQALLTGISVIAKLNDARQED